MPKARVSVVGMNLSGSHAWSNVRGFEPTGGVSNYLLGRDRKDWHSNIPQYARLRVEGVYDGIDLVFYGQGRDLEYDFVVAPGADPTDAAAAGRANGGVPDERLIGDVTGAAAHLRSLANANGKVGVIGYCSGGRQAVLTGCNVDVDAAVDCYGAFVIGDPPPDRGLSMTNIVDQLPNLRCPLLGLFGNDDAFPSPEQVDELDRILTDHDKPHEFHRYDGAGHAFFSVDRPSYRPEAANDGWERIEAFFGTYLGG